MTIRGRAGFATWFSRVSAEERGVSVAGQRPGGLRARVARAAGRSPGRATSCCYLHMERRHLIAANCGNICHWHEIASMTSRIYLRFAAYNEQIGIRTNSNLLRLIDMRSLDRSG